MSAVGRWVFLIYSLRGTRCHRVKSASSWLTDDDVIPLHLFPRETRRYRVKSVALTQVFGERSRSPEWLPRGDRWIKIRKIGPALSWNPAIPFGFDGCRAARSFLSTVIRRR